MRVSVVIPTYNEEDVIADCLESLAKQNFRDFEVIVVDDGSTDKTPSVLSECQNPKSLPYRQAGKFQILKQDHLGAGAARNFGAKKAKGEILVFVDADMTFEKNFLKKLISPILAGSAKGTFSKDEYVANWENVWARCWNFNEGWIAKRRHRVNYPDTQKVFRAILKKEFDRVGGFTPGGYTDDYTLSEKLGFYAAATRDAYFYHKNPGSLIEVFKQARWIGKRRYKLGFVGYVVAVVRALLPVSLLVGILKSIRNREPRFLVFKIIYDLGVTLGIWEFLISKKGGK